MIKIGIRSDKLAVVRFNHKVECNKFRDIMLKLQKDPEFSVKIKIKDERD